MTINLSAKLALDAKGFVAAAGEGKAAVEGLGNAAGGIVPLLARMDETLSLIALNTQRAGAAAEAAGGRMVAQSRAVAAAVNDNLAAVERLQARIDRLTGVSLPSADAAGRAADIQAYGRALDDLRARFDPLFAAGRRYREELAEIARAERLGALSADQAAAARARLKTSFAAVVPRITGADAAAEDARAEASRRAARASLQGLTGLSVGQAQAEGRALNIGGALSAFSAIPTGPIKALRQELKLTGQEAFQVGQQFQDFVSQVISGGNPLIAAAQQGSQLTAVLGGTGRAVAFLASLFTPLTVSIGASAAAVVAAGVAWKGYLDSTKAVQTTLAGLGRNGGVTAGALEAQTAGIATAAGLSRKEARALEVQLLSTGKIGATSIAGAADVVRDLAATLGTDAAGAGEQLAAILAKPAEGARRLSQELGLLDGATARRVQQLVAENREEEARATLLAALPGRLANAEAATTALGRAWNAVSRAASNAFDAVGKTIDRIVDGPSLEQRISDLEERVAAPQVRTGGAGRGLPADRELLASLRSYKALQDAYAASIRDTEQLTRRGDAALATANQSPANVDDARIRELKARITALNEGLASPSLTGAERNAIAAAVDAATRALETYIPAQEKAARVAELDRQIAEARDPLRRAELIARKEAVELSGQEMKSDQAAAAAALERTRAIQESLSAARNRAADTRDRASVTAATNAAIAGGAPADLARSRAETELELMPLVRAALAAEGAERERLIEVIRQQRAAAAELDAETRRGQALDTMQRQGDDLDRLRLEIALVGESASARERALAMLRTEQEIRARGYGPEEAERLRAGTRAIVERTEELRRQAGAWGEITKAGEGAADALTEALSSGDWSGAADAFAKDLRRQVAELTIANPLKNLLDGGNRTTALDVFDRLINGKAETPDQVLADVAGRSVGTMTVTAGTVVLSGLGGLPGLDPAKVGAGGRAAGAETGATAAPAGSIAARVEGAFAQFPAAAAGTGAALTFADRYKAGVDPRLTDILGEAARRFDLKVEATSGLRPGDPRFHGRGMATDVQIYDQAGRPLGNYQDASTFRTYERYAQTARDVQMERYPELQDRFRWGGYFSGGRGKYGAVDTMHFDLGGGRVGMAGGSWERGLTDAQRAMFPGAESFGMGRAGDEATRALEQLAQGSTAATDGLGTMSQGLGSVVRDLTGSSRTIGSAGERLGTATEAMAADTSSALGAIGQGLATGAQALIGSLGSIVSGLVGGKGGNALGLGLNFLSTLISGLFGAPSAGSSVPIPTPNPLGPFADGGYTGPGARLEPAGIVHRGEYVMDAEATRAIGVGALDALRRSRRLPGYAEGVYVKPTTVASGRAMNEMSGSRPIAVSLVNNGPPLQATARESDDGRGGRRLEITIDQMTSNALETGPRTRKTLASRGMRAGVIPT